MNELLWKNAMGIPIVEEDEKGFIPASPEEEIDLQQSYQQEEPAKPQMQVVQDEPEKPLSDDERVAQWWESTGISDIPELQGYKDERREKRAKYQQDMYNASKGLRSVIEGFAGDRGAYIDKQEQDTVTPRVQQELERIRTMDDQNQRDVLLRNWTRKLREADIKGGYLQNLENQEFQSGESQKNRDAQTDAYEQRNVDWDRRYGYQKDPEYLKAVAEIEKNKQIAIAQAKTATEKQKAIDKYDAMFAYQEKLAENGFSSTYANNQIKADNEEARKVMRAKIEEIRKMDIAQQLEVTDGMPPWAYKLFTGDTRANDQALDDLIELMEGNQPTEDDFEDFKRK